MADRYWVGGTASWDGTAGTKWALTSGGTGGQAIPTTADDVFFDAASGASTVNISAGNTGAKSINCNGFTGGFGGSGNITVAGSITLSTGLTNNHSGIMTITGTGSITTFGKQLGGITINGAGRTVTLVGNLTIISGRLLTITQGTFDAGSNNVTADSLSSSNSSARTITMGSGTWSLRGTTTSTVWNTATTTNLTFNKGTANIQITATTNNITRTFAGGGLSYNRLTLGGGAGTGQTFTITGSNTFTEIAESKTVAFTLNLTAGTTTTVTTWSVSGTAGNLLTLKSATTAAATLAKAGGGTATIDYATISYITGSPVSTWYATNSTDGGNNTNITFGAPPGANNSSFFMLF